MIAVTIKNERNLLRKGYNLIAGVDEAGIGPLAGPVVAAAVIIGTGKKVKGIDDSKKLTRGKRETLFRQIIESSISVGIGVADNSIIDDINILNASFNAIKAAVASLSIVPDHIMVDGIRKIPGLNIPQTTLKHGDSRSYMIASASIVAKVVRDRLMDIYDMLYPQYRFSLHKGYGTKEHMRILKKHGPSAIHRHSYEPVFNALISKGLLIG